MVQTPSFYRLFKINIGQEFLKPINKNVENNHTLGKVFNRKIVKISYSCTNNILKIINHIIKLFLINFMASTIDLVWIPYVPVETVISVYWMVNAEHLT